MSPTPTGHLILLSSHSDPLGWPGNVFDGSGKGVPIMQSAAVSKRKAAPQDIDQLHPGQEAMLRFFK